MRAKFERNTWVLYLHTLVSPIWMLDGIVGVTPEPLRLSSRSFCVGGDPDSSIDLSWHTCEQRLTIFLLSPLVDSHTT